MEIPTENMTEFGVTAIAVAALWGLPALVERYRRAFNFSKPGSHSCGCGEIRINLARFEERLRSQHDDISDIKRDLGRFLARIDLMERDMRRANPNP